MGIRAVITIAIDMANSTRLKCLTFGSDIGCLNSASCLIITRTTKYNPTLAIASKIIK